MHRQEVTGAVTPQWPEDVRLRRGSGWWLDGLRAFYLGFLTGLSVVPLCIQLGRFFLELRRSQLGLARPVSQSVRRT